MSTQHFLSNAQAQPPVLPPERWLTAFPQGHWGEWVRLQSEVQAGDVVWLSVGYPLWLEVLAQLLQRQPELRVVVLSAAPDQTEGLRAINQGARGYCHLYAVPELLQEVARVVQQGGLWVGPELVERHARMPGLDQGRRLLGLVAGGSASLGDRHHVGTAA